MPDENYYEVLVEYFEFEDDDALTSTVVENSWGCRAYVEDYIGWHREDFEKVYGNIYDIKIIKYQPSVVYSMREEEEDED